MVCILDAFPFCKHIQADPTARTFSVMQKSFSTALFSRAECISYLKKLLKSVHTAVYTWTSSIENHLNEELASEVMSAFIDSSMQESALEATPSSIHAMVQTLAMSQGWCHVFLIPSSADTKVVQVYESLLFRICSRI